MQKGKRNKYNKVHKFCIIKQNHRGSNRGSGKCTSLTYKKQNNQSQTPPADIGRAGHPPHRGNSLATLVVLVGLGGLLEAAHGDLALVGILVAVAIVPHSRGLTGLRGLEPGARNGLNNEVQRAKKGKGERLD